MSIFIFIRFLVRILLYRAVLLTPIRPVTVNLSNNISTPQRFPQNDTQNERAGHSQNQYMLYTARLHIHIAVIVYIYTTQGQAAGSHVRPITKELRKIDTREVKSCGGKKATPKETPDDGTKERR